MRRYCSGPVQQIEELQKAVTGGEKGRRWERVNQMFKLEYCIHLCGQSHSRARPRSEATTSKVQQHYHDRN